MKKLLFAALGLIGLLILGVAVLAFIAPMEYRVEREITINRARPEVFAYAKMLKNQDDWGTWAKKDPAMKKESRGIDGTVGYVASWSSAKSEVGEGEQEIKKIAENERIDWELRFKKPFEGKGDAYMVFESIGENQTKVKWGSYGPMDFPGNIFGYLMNMDKQMKTEFDEGLNGLKANLEKK